MSHIYKKEKCRNMKKEMWKHEKKKCRRQVYLIGRVKIWKRYKTKVNNRWCVSAVCQATTRSLHVSTATKKANSFFSNTFKIHRPGIGGYSLCQTFCMLMPSIQKSPIRFNPMELNNFNAASAFFTFLLFYLLKRL